MKSYTDIEQSKKLAEILPLESADMWFANGIYLFKTSEEPKDIKEVFPVWSLTALLNILPKYEIINYGDSIELNVDYDSFETHDNETLIDITVNMIINLHESDLL